MGTQSRGAWERSLPVLGRLHTAQAGLWCGSAGRMPVACCLFLLVQTGLCCLLVRTNGIDEGAEDAGKQEGPAAVAPQPVQRRHNDAAQRVDAEGQPVQALPPPCGSAASYTCMPVEATSPWEVVVLRERRRTSQPATHGASAVQAEQSSLRSRGAWIPTFPPAFTTPLNWQRGWQAVRPKNQEGFSCSAQCL
jgi:hypothetical protein